MEYPTTKQGWLKFINARFQQSMLVNCRYWPQLHEVRLLRELIKEGKLIRIREYRGSIKSRRTLLKINGSKVFMDAHDTVNVEESGSLPARTANKQKHVCKTFRK